MATKKAEIVKQEAVPREVEKLPLQQGPVEGFENMEPGDMERPRLAVCQSLTPQRQKDDPSYIKGLSEGEFFNSITGENYGASVRVTPLMFFKYRLRFKKAEKQERGGLLCQSQNGKVGVGDPGGDCSKCALRLWGTHGEKPECTELYGFASLIVPSEGDIRFDNLAVVSMKGANTRLAKSWLAMARMRQGEDKLPLPMWRGIYDLVSVKKTFPLGSAYMIVPKNAGAHKFGSPNAAICRTSYYMIKEMYDANRLAVDMGDERAIDADEIAAE